MFPFIPVVLIGLIVEVCVGLGKNCTSASDVFRVFGISKVKIGPFLDLIYLKPDFEKSEHASVLYITCNGYRAI